ncbi:MULTISPECIES: sensor histidine kinase [Clostridium]|uniref:histidine kinase n=2 Tax=Clostridium TaxID=1485 RepID=A0A170NP59_9CLOT|nr:MULTISPECIES: HAMP domain-containing sensor histidine kinase [Clostridium]OAA94228.1 Alkaline phosphatase synthesis sensor protein PhoR [Clostridium coskatii]OBR95608.1 alkaline phosphatase synthesis sensor protein PhoR [Clostridium coskatii]RMC95837.1 sensor histidine kinase [Clostridium autoethanogenum]
MYLFIIILLGILAGISITLLFLTKSEIKHITGSLKKINDIDTNQKVTLSFQNRSFQNLALEINKNIDKKQQTEVKYKHMDMELRQAIANISHDLRTPLTSIIGYIQLIKSDDLSKDEKNEYMDIILNRAKSLKMLISGFFDLSRLEANEYAFELESISLSNILCELIASFYNDFTNKEIEPLIEIDENAPEIIGDENAVRRVFSNLIQNALKHGDKFISVSLKKDGNYIVTTFANNANNLNSDDIDHLFERFFTGDRTRTGKNTGLGLAITKALVEQMGHSITANFKDNKLSIIIKWKIS